MTRTNKPLNELFLQVEIMSFTRTSLRSLTVLMQDDGVASSKFESEPENYIVDQLKRWLKCTGFKLSGKRDELVKGVPECITLEIITLSIQASMKENGLLRKGKHRQVDYEELQTAKISGQRNVS